MPDAVEVDGGVGVVEALLEGVHLDGLAPLQGLGGVLLAHALDPQVL